MSETTLGAENGLSDRLTAQSGRDAEAVALAEGVFDLARFGIDLDRIETRTTFSRRDAAEKTLGVQPD